MDGSVPVFLVLIVSQSVLRLISIVSLRPSNHLILYHALLLLPAILPSIRVFSSEPALHIRSPKYWSISFSISPSYKCSRLISCRKLTSLISLLSKERPKSSPAPQFESINLLALSLLYGSTLTLVWMWEYWSGLPVPSSVDLPNPGIKLGSPHCRWILYQLSYQGSPSYKTKYIFIMQSKIMVLGIYFKDWKTYLHKSLHTGICSGFIHNYQNLEATKMSFCGWVNK